MLGDKLRSEKKRVGIAALSGHFSRDLFQVGIQKLHAHGFDVIYDNSIFDQYRYFAGDDQRRLNEINRLLTDDSIDIILFARGGYGVQRLLTQINWAQYAHISKTIVGLSDLTPLLNMIAKHTKCHVYYGPVLTQLAQGTDMDAKGSFLRALLSPSKSYTISLQQADIIQSGNCEGRTAGGCISMLSTSVGTAYHSDLPGKIVMLEDVNEHVYALDRMLMHLINSSQLLNAKAILFGTLENRADDTHDMKEMILDCLSGFSGPIVMSCPFGHCANTFTVALNRACTLSAMTAQDSTLYLMDAI